MNYSDYDSDGYSSNEDEDYVPSDENLSEDDINECEREEPLHPDDSVPHREEKKKKMKRKDVSVRRRRKGVLKVDQAQEEGGDGGEEAWQRPEEEKEEEPTKATDDEERQKKKSDDLWASFLSDVGSRPKESNPAPQPKTRRTEDSSPLLKVSPSRAESQDAAKITITKVFDFAGEEVRVDKEVSADSREAKSFLKSQSSKQEEREEEERKNLSPSGPPTPPGPSAKRPAGMSGLLSRIGGKKPKMSTLEKSKMDWEAFKSEEGISEELAIHNRGREGYVERKNFLERVDHRQFELEKAVRLSNMKQ